MISRSGSRDGLPMNGRYVRKDIEFNAEGSFVRGWLYLPLNGARESPAIVMAHGFGALKEMYLDRYAKRFAEAGFAVVVFDYRGFGDSEGDPRLEVDPWRQIEDYRHAVTYACTLDEIDSNNIGLWGTSYSGGHVLVAAAIDHRVNCVVSQVPTICGTESSKRRIPAEEVKKLYKLFDKDRVGRMKGEQPITRMLVSSNPNDRPIYGSEDALKWYTEAGERSPNWSNKVTIRSVEYSRWYNPGDFISLISPTPLLLLVGTEDDVTPTDLALKAYESALEPKKLVLLPGGHFDPYTEGFDQASGEAVAWFDRHLKQNVSQFC